MADFSVVIPHKQNDLNDYSLTLLLNCLYALASGDYQFEVIIDNTTPADPYVLYNRMTEQASTDYVLMLNSDTFPAKDWDHIFKHAKHNAIVVPQLVECGAIGVAQANIEMNFGMTPYDFNKNLHQWGEWVKVATAKDMRKPDYWYMPCLMPRKPFLDLGGFPTDVPFMERPNDIIFFDKWKETGRKIHKSNTYWYHLQNWSQGKEQEKAVRW